MQLTTALTTIMAVIIAYSIIKYGLLSPMSFSIQKKLVVSFLVIILVVSSSALITANTISTENIKQQTFENLESVARSKANWLDLYFSELENDILVLGASPFVNQILDEKLSLESISAKSSIRETAKRVAGEVENYIKTHPDMTIEDLQNDSVFQDIAVQPVGDTGYTALTDYDTLICRFHKKESTVNLDLHILADKLPGFWSIMSKTQGGLEAEGFYGWEEEGVVRNKYMYISIVQNVTTNDSVGLSVAATAYVDEYSTSLELSWNAEEYLQYYKDAQEYSDILLVGSNGDVWWTAAKDDELGTNLFTWIYNDTQLSYAFKAAKFKGVSNFSDLEPNEHSNLPFFYVSTPVYANDIYAGALILRISVKQINEIMLDITGLGETGEAYLVGPDFLLRSKTRHSMHNNSILEQNVDTENIRNGFEPVGNAEEHVGHAAVSPFLDYRDVRVIGTHYYIDRMNWVLVAEMDETEILEPVNLMQDRMIIVFVFITFFGIVFSLLISRSLSKPIINLKTVVKEMESGNFNARIDVRSDDEIGGLSKSFNIMAKSLKKHTENLEDQVNARTKEFKENITELEKFKKVTVGRELKMAEMKKEIKHLKEKQKNKGDDSND